MKQLFMMAMVVVPLLLSLSVSADVLVSKIKYGGVAGLLGSKGELYISKSVEDNKGTAIVSPGGAIPSTAMSGLAEGLAKEGFVVFVVRYPLNLAIIPGGWNKVFSLAKLVKNNPDRIRLDRSEDPSALALATERFTSNSRVVVVGHSLGGAILGHRFGMETDVDQFYLVGVDSLVLPPSNPIADVTLLVGENDCLANPAGNENLTCPQPAASDKLLELADYLQQDPTILPGVNHFCIISDPEVGDADKRAEDGPGLASSACIDILVSFID
ncbi:MAG: hypothetical protein HRU19_30115 [Pseudobacteriovorax sp.]|nr:hypothetical protein [Pseudobacteriovorax sp.]